MSMVIYIHIYVTRNTLIYVCTVWSELEKENKEFFEAYAQSQSKQERMSEEQTSQMIQKMISDSSKDPDE